MIPDPLHPAVVHFPIVLMMLAPLVAIGSLWAIARGTAARKAWGITVALFAALAVSVWVAAQTGEQQEERVERVVAEQPLELHEEAAELLLYASAAVLLLGVAGLAGGSVGRGARIVSVVGALAVVGLGWRVGHSGGELVYRHGAASAYAPAAGTVESGELNRERRARAVDRERESERGG